MTAGTNGFAEEDALEDSGPIKAVLARGGDVAADAAEVHESLEAAEGAHSTRLQHVRTDGARGNNQFQLMVRQGESSEAQP